MADLTINRKSMIVSMSGVSSVESVSKPSSFALLMFFSGNSKVTSEVKTVNTIVIDPVLNFIDTGYDSISTNNCIGTSIQTHGPPMVDIKSFLQSFTVFTANYKNSYQHKTNNFKLNIKSCG